jgi:hypothetical protein
LVWCARSAVSSKHNYKNLALLLTQAALGG